MPKPSRAQAQGGPLKLHRDCGFGGVSIAPRQPQKAIKPLVSETGTALAINYLTSGVAALSARSIGRGGARNHADRESHALTAAQIGNLKSAERHAEKIGLPFTRMISIHWQAAGVPLARHGGGTAWLWTHENSPGNGHHKGGHCHLLVHVSADLVPVVTALQRGWLRRITGQPYRARVIHSKPIGGRLGLEAGNPDLHAVNLEVAVAYVLKGASPDAASQFGLERLEAGGRIIGKRCGTSQNIGAKARKAKE
jgi:hypothetical protein